MLRIATLFVFFSSLAAVAPKTYQVKNSQSSLQIAGTSTLHDWTIDATNVSGSASLAIDGNQVTIESLGFNVRVNSLKSGKAAMDKNTYKAMNSDAHPNVKYQFVRMVSRSDNLLKTAGKLTIGQVTKSVYLDVTTSVGSAVKFKGKTTFKMSDYGIEPPTAVFGSIKTGDQVTITFDVAYE